MLEKKHFKLMTAAAATGLFLAFTLFTAPLFPMAAFTTTIITAAGGGGFIQQAVANNDPSYSLLRQASAQEESTPPPQSPTLPFTPFSLQQQQEQEEAVQEEEEEGEEGEGEEGEGQPIQEPGVPSSRLLTNDTVGVTEPTIAPTEPPRLRANIITNGTYLQNYPNDAIQVYTGDTIKFDASITGGAPPYSYTWYVRGFGAIDQDRSITQTFFEPGTFDYTLTVTDSSGRTGSNYVYIIVEERPPRGEGIVAPEPGGVAPPEEGEPIQEPGVPLTAEIIANATQVVAPATIKFDSKVTGGTEPYNYRWKLLTGRFTPEYFGAQLVLVFQIPGTYTFILNVTDSKGQTASDSVQFTVGGLELPPSDIGEVVPPPEGGEVLLPPETGGEGQPPGGGLLPGIAPGEGTPPPPDDTGGGEEEEGTPPPSSTTEETPGDDTGGGEEEQPVTEEEEAATSPPPANDGGG